MAIEIPPHVLAAAERLNRIDAGEKPVDVYDTSKSPSPLYNNGKWSEWEAEQQAQFGVACDNETVADWCRKSVLADPLYVAGPDLLEALQRLMALDCPLSGNPSHEKLVKFWQHEKTEGRGEADDQLFALAAVAKATQPATC